MNSYLLAWSPLVPWAVVWMAALAGAAILGYGAWRRARGTPARALALAVVLLGLAGPSLVKELRQPQKDVALLVKDVSVSQRIGDRAARADTVIAALHDKLAQDPDLEIRTIDAGRIPAGVVADTGTELFGPIARALADVPAQRVAGVAVVTDGEVHDVPPSPVIQAPLHVLLDGARGEADRRISIHQAPSFGIVGKDLQLTLQVDDLGQPGPETARVAIRRDGGSEQVAVVPVGHETTLPVTLVHGGPTVFEIAVEAGPHELTLDNNRAAIVVHGVRDRLKVLLVSGEPHAGERTWRNLLKSDPSVDLVHFTILRPPEKQDGTPIRELSLIAFPIRELFDLKLDEFDLIIFDRYQRRGLLPQTYLNNIARYVRNGGALLEASGSSPGTAGSLFRTPLGSVLPAEPTGDVFEQGFRPAVTNLGKRHPVTADLPEESNGPDGSPGWGRWFREADATQRSGRTLMTGVNGAPLLVLDRVGEGRVAQLLSDEIWLWTRGYEGGGPQAELLRRLSYWLMKEPDLEENDLRASVDGSRLTIVRRSLEPDPHPVQVTKPDGSEETVELRPESGGQDVAVLPITEPGLYRVTDSTRTALAAAGALNPIEFSDLRTTDEKVKSLALATGGSVNWTGSGGSLPEIRRVRADRAAAGNGWIGFRQNGDYVVTGVSETDLMPAWLALLAALGALLLAWRQEAR